MKRVPPPSATSFAARGVRPFAGIVSRTLADFVPASRQGLRTFALQKTDQLFAQFGTEIGRVAGTGCGYQHAQFERVRTCIRNLHIHKLAAGLFCLSSQLYGLGPNTFDGRAVIEIKQNAAEVGLRLPCPVIERLLNEIIERYDESPLVPQPDDDIGR